MSIEIISNFLESNTIPQLKKIIKKKNLKNFSRLKKNDLIKIILKNYAIIKIQRRVRKFLAVNDTCPISLEDIKYPCWPRKSTIGFSYYNLDSLVDFMITRGDFRDPQTRKEYSDDELKKMDAIYNCKEKSLIKAKKKKSYYRREKVKEEQIDILNERVRSTICAIRDKIENLLYECHDLTVSFQSCYFIIIHDNLKMLNTRCQKTCQNAIIDMKRIIEKVECHQILDIKRMKNFVLNWIDKEDLFFFPKKLDLKK